jgi:hypothetical protein
MMRAWVAMGLGLSLWAPVSWAQPASSAAPKATPKAAGSAAAAGASAKLPPGHPPPGAAPPPGAMPPGHRAPPPSRGSQGGGFSPPKDRVMVGQDLPAGVIDVQIVDGSEKPLANAPISLTILKNTVTEGESKRDITGHADEKGHYHFKGLPTGTGISYRVTSTRDEAIFVSTPFGLKDKNGVRVLLHSFESIRELADAPFVIEAVVLLDVKQDSIAVNHLLRTLNIGRQAYVATGIRIPLPEGAKAFDKGESEAGIGMVESDGAMELVGTFPPGEGEMTYRYNVPFDGDEANLKIPLPPRVVASRVVVGAGPQMSLEVTGYPEAQIGRWQDGKRVLQTTKQSSSRTGLAGLMQNTSPQILNIKLAGLPSSGMAPTVALILAIVAGLGGFGYLFTHRDERTLAEDQREDLEEAQLALLGEFELLEKSRRRGDIGPRTYKRLRLALLDALARIVTRLERVPKPRRANAQPTKPKSTSAKPKLANAKPKSASAKPKAASGDGDAKPKRRKPRRGKRSPAAKA